MLTSVFCEYLNKLDSTTKRLEITSILSDLYSNLDEIEIAKGVYLSLGTLDAPFRDKKFNIAEKQMIKVLESAYQQTDVEAQYKKLGDLGNVAYELAKEKNFTQYKVTVGELHKMLIEIAQTEGTGSVDAKKNKLIHLLEQLDPLSTKYVVRIVLGLTRLGFTELTCIDALAHMCGSKEYISNIEPVYNMHPDIGLIAEVLKSKGLEGLETINIATGIPVLSQKAQRAGGIDEIMERIPKGWCEFKFDGTRAQLHMDRDKQVTTPTTETSLFGEATKFLIKTFTRNLEETTYQYPDIVAAADKQIDAQSIIVDGEAIGYNKDTGEFLPFQETIQRKRKHNISEMVQNVPLKYFVFDILYLNGKSLVHLPLTERHKILETVIKKGDVIVTAEHKSVETTEDLSNYFEEAKEKRLEGLIVKKPEDPYQAGARSYSWIKLKKADEKLLDDSVDCVVLGYYVGKGVRTKFGIGGFLVGVYDKATDTFKTISKVGTGLTESDWLELKTLCDKLQVSQPIPNVDIPQQFTPDVLVKPSLVVEVGADEISISPTHSAKYALRFPRLLKIRTDKSATQSTGTNEIETMFKLQRNQK